MRFDPDEATQAAYTLSIPFIPRQFLNPRVQTLQLVRQIVVCNQIFLKCFFFLQCNIESAQPFQVVLRPEAFATRILFSQPQDKGCNLLFDFLQREFLIVPHPQIFLDRIVFTVRHIDRAVGVESQTPGNVSGIFSVGLDPICIGNAHGGRREDDAFDAVGGELMIERITEASGLISADEFHFFRIFPAHLLQIFQYKPVVGGYRLPVFNLISVKTVAAKCVVFFMDIHSYIKYTVHRGLPLYAVIPVTLPSIVSIQVNPRPYNGEVTSYYLFLDLLHQTGVALHLWLPYGKRFLNMRLATTDTKRFIAVKYRCHL